MGKKSEIRTLDVVRNIHDARAELLRNKSNEEIIAFFRKAANEFRARVQRGSHGESCSRVPPSAREDRQG